MKILASWPATLLIHAGVLEMLVTILGCYSLAVANGHVPAWLPMISDCAVYPPEKYPFRLGIVIGACLLAVQVITTYNVNKESQMAKPMAILALVASAGLAVVAVVNEKENDAIHDFGAVVFFAGYDIYAVLTLWFGSNLSPLSFIIKSVTAVIGVGSFVGYITCIYIGLYGSVYFAMFEWLNTFAIMAFLWSFVLDELKDITLSEVEEDGESQPHAMVEKTNAVVKKTDAMVKEPMVKEPMVKDPELKALLV